MAVAVVLGISLAETALAHVNQTTVALTLLLAVLGIATCWGLVESLAASVAGMLCFNVLFLPPVGKLTIAATENWVAFITFVVTAVVASQLSASAKRRAREAARRQLKSVMLDAVAHEFKTPLTAVKAAVTSLLSEASAAPARRELLEVIDEETDLLTSMVTEAIQVARIETGRIELRKAPHSIAAVIRESLSRMAGALEGRVVQVQASDALPAIAADRELLLMVFRQLLDNAVKYSSPDSPITLRATARDNWMEVTVADRGPGLSRVEARRAFEEFYRGRAAGGIPGTGMGLAIARKIVAAHGGDMRVESRHGQGSELKFRLPLVQQGTEP